MRPTESLVLKRADRRTIIHFDYDCFYAQVFEREDPKLRHLPLAVQQKQIIVTCNYEARRRGLHKLQLVKEARKKCPDLIIVLGEDLSRFRNASKELYAFLRNYAWSDKVERLGFDEVFIDLTDMVDYNAELVNYNNPSTSFFHLDRHDPTVGFPFDASVVAGHVYPTSYLSASSKQDHPAGLHMHLVLGSHLAQHMRHQLEEQKGYTSTVGISTNKLLSKLVGNLNKPKGQTTLIPSFSSSGGEAESNVTKFIDGHEIGKIPGLGFKLAQKIRAYVLGRPATFDAGVVYGGTKETVMVGEVRLRAEMCSTLLEKLVGGYGAPKGIGDRVWGLLNGIDDDEVCKAKAVPHQISIEDSYLRLDSMDDVKKELVSLMESLIKRMRLDLMSPIDEADDVEPAYQEGLAHPTTETSYEWIAHPKTLRLTTRPRLPLNPDGTRERSFGRISKSCNMPSIIYSKSQTVEFLAERITQEALIALFHKLHPEQSGWNLSLINICATNMALVATDHNKDGPGRDIGRMFKTQESRLKEWQVEDVDDIATTTPFGGGGDGGGGDGGDSSESEQRTLESENNNNIIIIKKKGVEKEPTEHTEPTAKGPPPPPPPPQADWINGSLNGRNTSYEQGGGCCLDDDDDKGWWWDSDENNGLEKGEICRVCGARMPSFAMEAHERFHNLTD